METQPKSEKAELAKLMVSWFGMRCKTLTVEMLYTKEVQTFLCKVKEAHQKTANSKIVFG